MILTFYLASNDFLYFNNPGIDNAKEKEEQEEQRLAKIFTKRARMNRLLSIYDDDAEFSQERLNVSEDLKNVKVRKRRYTLCIYCLGMKFI